MNEEQHDVVGRLALLMFVIESRKTNHEDRKKAEREFQQKAAELNELCNGKPSKREAVTNG